MGARILVIDDDLQVSEMLQITLESAGYEVQVASDGAIGFEMFRKNPADLIITDLIMPEKEGIETISDIMKEFPDAKIIAISGGGRGAADVYLEMARIIGAQYVFEKPVPSDELLAAIKDLIS